MGLDGKCAMVTEISSTMVQSRMACRYPSTSNFPVSLSRKATKLMLARLQAVSSRNMYSEHGLEARISPPSGQVCHSLMVEWYCMPGSAQAQAASAICCHMSAALTVLTLPSTRLTSSQSPSSSTVCMKRLSTRTELFEFWPETVM